MVFSLLIRGPSAFLRGIWLYACTSKYSIKAIYIVNLPYTYERISILFIYLLVWTIWAPETCD
jgi:hypothetical protein